MEIIREGLYEKNKFGFKCSHCMCVFVAKVRECTFNSDTKEYECECPSCGRKNTAQQDCYGHLFA